MTPTIGHLYLLRANDPAYILDAIALTRGGNPCIMSDNVRGFGCVFGDVLAVHPEISSTTIIVRGIRPQGASWRRS